MTADGQKIAAEGYGDQVVQRLSGLRRNGELCDFTVSADGRVFEVHKALLAATSDYFRVMFSGVMAESKQNTVDLKAVTADGLQHIIDFIYSGEMAVNLDNLTEIINGASHLQVSLALDVCSAYIKSLMTFDNSEDFLHIADTYSLDKVTAHWDHMIQDKFFEFSQSTAFSQMEGEVLCGHLARDTLRVSSELQLLLVVGKWAAARPGRLAQDGARCLQHVRLALLSEAELGVARDHELLTRCPAGQVLLARAFQFHLDCKKGQPVLEPLCRVRAPGPALVMVHHGTSHVPFQLTAYNRQSQRFYTLFSDVNGSRDCRVASIHNFAYICRIVDFGGGTLMSSLFRFDPRHLAGQELRPMRHLRLEFALLAHRGALYALGGCTEQFTILDSVERYHVETNSWEEMAPLPAPTHSLAAAAHGDRVFLSGGVSGQDRTTTNAFFCLDPNPPGGGGDGVVSRGHYHTLPPLLYARRLHDMVCVGERLYVAGGIPKQGAPLYGQIPIECYSLAARQWTLLSSTLSGRSVGHYTNLQGHILALGHEHSSATEDELWTFNPDLDDWFRFAKAPHRMSLNSAMCTQLYVNFDDEKIANKFIKNK